MAKKLKTTFKKEEEMAQVGDWIADVISNVEDTHLHVGIRESIAAFASRYPMPGIDA